jgi:protein required for attachment to host cells
MPFANGSQQNFIPNFDPAHGMSGHQPASSIQRSEEKETNEMLIPHGTVITLVDGENWEVLRNSGTEAEPELTKMPTPELAETNHGSGGRHGVSSANPSAHQRDEDAHAAAVGDWLNTQVQTHKIEKLIVIASPRTLGELRHRYSKAVQAVLVSELAKDLIGRQPSDILTALRHR